MTESKTDPSPRPSSDLRRAIGADTARCFVDAAVLAESDIATVRRALSGQGGPQFTVNRKRALGALARSDPSEETAELLACVVADAGAPMHEREAAAAYIGLLPQAVAERPLLAALPCTSGPLRIAVVKALGHVGTGETLARLREIEAGGDAAGRQLALTRLAIAFREGCEDTGPDELRRALDIGWNTIEAARLDGAAVRETIGAIDGPTYNIPINPDIGFRFECGRLQQVVLLNAALKGGAAVRTLTGANMVAGLLVAQVERVRSFSVRWLLLTSPSAEGVKMVLVRKNGEPAFEGSAVPEGEMLRFRLRDTGLERVPAEIDGHIGDDDARWTMRVWAGGSRSKRRPQPISC